MKLLGWFSLLPYGLGFLWGLITLPFCAGVEHGMDAMDAGVKAARKGLQP